jgi:P27 family predicted phage terminase small subunit
MPRGPKPKPLEIRQKEGTLRPSRHGEAPVAIPTTDIRSMLEPPEHLDESAKMFWREAVPTLVQAGIISAVDRAALELASTMYARARQAGRVIAEQGHLARGSTGQLVEHPSLRTERDAAINFLRFAEHYALTPVARTRLGMAELERKSLQQEMKESFGEPNLTPA